MTPSATLICCDDRERRALTRKAPLYGLDYLEVSADPPTLTVYFLGQAPDTLANSNLRITGGQRIRDIRVLEVQLHPADDPEQDGSMVVSIDRLGDFATYTLCVVALDREGRPTDAAPPDFDPRYACLDFTFQTEAAADLDCASDPVCPPQEREQPDVNYLAKDYASFRQLMLDRLALVMPDWRERHVPDLGITLVELLAYAGDHLSYHQDAVATEAYLDTARLRISVRRHARLVDYVLHEGCNARTWLALSVSEPAYPLALGSLSFVTATEDHAPSMLDAQDLPHSQPAPYVVFEPLVNPDTAAVTLYQSHNEIRIYTWRGTQCCLPKGATSATLLDPGKPPEPTSGVDAHPKPPPAARSATYHGAGSAGPERPREEQYALQLGQCDVLIFEEIRGARTGNPADADRTHRHAVRLTRATRSFDPVPDPRRPTLLVEVEWSEDDALPFPLCISSIGPGPQCEPIDNVSVARGNVLLVDHGQRTHDDLDQVPGVTIEPECCDRCAPREVRTIAGPYGAELPKPDVTFAEPMPPCRLPPLGCGEETRITSAAALLRQDPRNALPWVALDGYPATPEGQPAFERRDLLDPTAIARRMADPRHSVRASWLRGHLTSAARTRLDQWAATSPPAELPAELREVVQQLLRSLLQNWSARLDLLASNPGDRHFTVEMDDERRAHLRFGNGESGRGLDAGMSFQARYRTGNGTAGNVGAETIRHLVFDGDRPHGIEIRCRNPFAAAGGMAPEPVQDAKALAPHLFRHRLERAITAADYAAIAMRDFGSRVQRAAAVVNRNGMGGTVIVAIDARGREEADPVLLCEIGRHLQRYRRIGHDVRVVPARTVPLDIELKVRVRAGYLYGHVRAALLQAFSNRRLPGGGSGYFHPDRLSFGEGIYLSRLVAVAQAVTGVESIRVSKLERFYEGPNAELQNGVLPLAPLEIARADSDPNFPEHGRVVVVPEDAT